jgi:hypothetical protein
MLSLLRQQPPLPIQVSSAPSEARMLGQWEGFQAAIAAIEALALEESWKKPEPTNEQTNPEDVPNLDID